MTKMGLRIASLEDDAAEAAWIREIVTAEGRECVTFADSRRMLVTLRKVSFDLLLLELALLLFRNEGRAVPREHVLVAIWSTELPPMSRTIDTHVSRVRNKLGLWERNGVRLLPVYTHGYRLELVGVPVIDAPPKKKKGTRRCLSYN